MADGSRSARYKRQFKLKHRGATFLYAAAPVLVYPRPIPLPRPSSRITQHETLPGNAYAVCDTQTLARAKTAERRQESHAVP